MRACYQGYLERGMLKKKALIAIARKLLRILFALVRDHRRFVQGFSQAEPLDLAA